MYRNVRTAIRTIPAKSDAVAFLWFEDVKVLPMSMGLLDAACGLAISSAMKRKEFSAARGVVTTLHPERGWHTVLIAGLGSRENVSAETVRVAAAALVRAAFAAGVRVLHLRLAHSLSEVMDANVAGRAAGDGIAIAGFEFTSFKGTAAKPANGKPVDLTIACDKESHDAIKRSLTVGRSVNVARTLAATPPNVANPRYLVDHCRAMAKRTGLKCEIIDEKQARKLKLGGLLAVGAGGSTPPAMICLEHKPKGAGKQVGPVLLVGKAVTFDTGGYSIKPAQDMDRMKYDKCGGMAVIGAMQAVAELNLPVHVVGLIPAAENMVDTSAYRPGDIIAFHNGVTAEITNTDAEGRLILADALAYGTARYSPAAVIDLATLTGGVIVALGTFCAGYFCNDDKLRGRLSDAADFTGERLWQLPLWNEHRDMMKGTHGDLVNSGAREAHPIQGAAFLSFFVGKDAPRKLPTLPWAHLDIAGMSDNKSDGPLYAKGPTGYGVRLLVRTLETWNA